MCWRCGWHYRIHLKRQWFLLPGWVWLGCVRHSWKVLIITVRLWSEVNEIQDQCPWSYLNLFMTDRGRIRGLSIKKKTYYPSDNIMILPASKYDEKMFPPAIFPTGIWNQHGKCTVHSVVTIMSVANCVGKCHFQNHPGSQNTSNPHHQSLSASYTTNNS